MSLDFELGKIADWETLCNIMVVEDGKEHKVINPVTQSIIFGCLSTGIGQIDEDNYMEWYGRYAMWNGLRGYDNLITLDDVRKHIGLRTNVFPKESRTKWLKRHLDYFISDTKWALKRQLESAK